METIVRFDASTNVQVNSNNKVNVNRREKEIYILDIYKLMLKGVYHWTAGIMSE